MNEADNKSTLKQANAEIAKGNYEGFLTHCTEDTLWTFVDDKTLQGKEAVRQWMAKEYAEPPVNSVDVLIAEGEYVTAMGEITVGGVTSAYCNVWRFEGGKLAELRAWVVGVAAT